MWRLREMTLSPHTAQYAEALFRIAQLYERRNMLDESEAVCKEVLRLRDMFFGWESLVVAEVLLLIALLRARAMRLDESELLLKEVLRIAQLFSGNTGVEVHGAVVLFAHIYMIRGNTDLAIRLHMEALQLQLHLSEPAAHPTEPCSGNMAKVWSLNFAQDADNANSAVVGVAGAQSTQNPSSIRSIWTDSCVGGAASDHVHAIMFSLPEGCAPEVLANWVVHSDLLEAKGYAKRRVYEPENSMAVAWAAAGADKQELEPLDPVSEDVVEFFIDRTVHRGQNQSGAQAQQPSEEAHVSQQELPLPNDSQQPQSSSTAFPAWAHGVSEGMVQSMYQDCLGTGGSMFINLYANVSEQPPADAPPPAHQAPAVQVQGFHVRSIGGGGGGS
jgi:hypothetical protein